MALISPMYVSSEKDMPSMAHITAVGDSNEGSLNFQGSTSLASKKTNAQQFCTRTNEMDTSSSTWGSPTTQANTLNSAAKVKHGFGMPVKSETQTSSSSCTSSITSTKNDAPTSPLRAASISNSPKSDAESIQQNAKATNALDALATLASSSYNRLSLNLTDDTTMMPPPPNRKIRRMRSASNPEGMEKWDSYYYPSQSSYNDAETDTDSNSSRSNRGLFVLPTSILEEELASANDACEAFEKRMGVNVWKNNIRSGPVPVRKSVRTDFSIHSQPEVDCDDLYGTSPTTVVSMEQLGKSSHTTNGIFMDMSMTQDAKDVGSDASSSKTGLAPSNSRKNAKNGKGLGKKQTLKKKKRKNQKKADGIGRQRSRSRSNSIMSEGDIYPLDEDQSQSDEQEEEKLDEVEEEVDESDLEPAELLKRARSRLFEDLSAENGGLEKGTLAMPHSLDKYKEIYNKNGRIGIYTPAERAAIIAKFNSKRTRRTWKKKIRYNCRKSLADRRMRVKGRFVKRAVEQKKSTSTNNSDQDSTVGVRNATQEAVSNTVNRDQTASPTLESEGASSGSDSSRTSSPMTIGPASGPLAPVIEDMDGDGDTDVDMDMPDVNDPDAGFKPTADQPFRRTRRHTIT